MKRPVVGVIGNAHRFENRFATQMVGERNLRALAEVAGALPLMFAGSPEITDVGALLDAVDGIVLTGARANVHPTRFNTEPDIKHEPYDLHRDAGHCQAGAKRKKISSQRKRHHILLGGLSRLNASPLMNLPERDDHPGSPFSRAVDERLGQTRRGVWTDAPSVKNLNQRCRALTLSA